MRKDIEKWIDLMKIAILEENEEQAFYLTQNLPFKESDNIDDEYIESLEIAKELIWQSKELLEKRQNEALTQLDKIRLAKKFLS